MCEDLAEITKLAQREQGNITDEAGDKLVHIEEFEHYRKGNENLLKDYLQRKSSNSYSM